MPSHFANGRSAYRVMACRRNEKVMIWWSRNAMSWEKRSQREGEGSRA